MSLAALTVSAALAGSPAAAAAEANASAASVEEIVVTGTRVVRDGYEAPTPLTVVGVEAIQDFAASNIADYVNTLPVLSGSATPQTSQQSISSGTAGINALNLRAMGPQRTLVLLDGQRSVGSTLDGQVDINNFPQGLVSRVEVVTGGASAAYGSDALTGVVNFILDTHFTGLKGEVAGGITTYGDNANWSTALTGGTAFANERGHVVFNAEVSHKDGIIQADRVWNSEPGWGIMINPNYTATNGQPQRLLLPRVGLSNAAPGGMITAGPLKGVVFGPGGSPYQFNYGSLVTDPNMQGGDWRAVQVRETAGKSLDSRQGFQRLFTRISYDIADTVEIYAQASWGHTKVFTQASPQSNPANIVIRGDNAFIPAPVAARVAALNLTTLQIGTMNGDLPALNTDNDRTVNRYVAGASGTVNAFSGDWNWDAYYQKGISRSSSRSRNITRRSLFALAIDAVRSPNGTIVCRSSIANPLNGCVPWNVLGIGVNSQAALDYVTGDPYRYERLSQDVLAASATGEPFSLWAGPVSFAFGVEHRTEKVGAIVDPFSLANDWFVGNFLPTSGKVGVTEGFLETVVPLANQASWAESLELNAAVRFTDYTTSGFVVTWKAGVTYTPVPDIKFRVTRSRDIRAPNLQELYQAGGANSNSLIDPFNNNIAVAYQGLNVGNPNLMPEKADTTGVGAVLQPSFVPGLNASVDYWNINVKDAIGTIGAQSIVDLCFAGNQQFCAAITRGLVNGANVITQVRTSPFNLIKFVARGIDFEAGYQIPLDTVLDDWRGNLTLRALATRYLRRSSNNGVNPETDNVGENSGNGPPRWRWTASVGYDSDRFRTTISARGISAGVYNNTFIECTTGCPTATVLNPTINDNRIAGATYFDASFTYRLGLETNWEAFLSVKNLANKDPAVVAPGPGSSPWSLFIANSSLYDIEGRTFRTGVRFSW